MSKRTNGSPMTTSGGLPPSTETMSTMGWRAHGLVGRSLGSALAMSVACGATMLVASHLRSGSPWVGLNALASAAGLGPNNVRKRFDPTATLAGAGMLAAGLLVVAALYQGARAR